MRSSTRKQQLFFLTEFNCFQQEIKTIMSFSKLQKYDFWQIDNNGDYDKRDEEQTYFLSQWDRGCAGGVSARGTFFAI